MRFKPGVGGCDTGTVVILPDGAGGTTTEPTCTLRAAIEEVNAGTGIDIIRFGAEDIVRHPLVTKIVNAYEAANTKADPISS